MDDGGRGGGGVRGGGAGGGEDAPLALRLVSWAKDEAVFEGPGVPSGRVKLTYRRPEPDVLAVTLDKGGKPQEFRMRRRR